MDCNVCENNIFFSVDILWGYGSIGCTLFILIKHDIGKISGCKHIFRVGFQTTILKYYRKQYLISHQSFLAFREFVKLIISKLLIQVLKKLNRKHQVSYVVIDKGNIMHS